MWLHLSLIKDMLTFCRELFPVVSYCTTAVPTYPCGQIGFILCSKNPVSKQSIFFFQTIYFGLGNEL